MTKFFNVKTYVAGVFVGVVNAQLSTEPRDFTFPSNKVKGKMYGVRVVPTGESWTEAQAFCSGIGMELVTFDDQEEFDWVTQALDDSVNYWTGYRDDVQGVITSATGKTDFFTKMQDGWDDPAEPNEKCIL